MDEARYVYSSCLAKNLSCQDADGVLLADTEITGTGVPGVAEVPEQAKLAEASAARSGAKLRGSTYAHSLHEF